MLIIIIQQPAHYTGPWPPCGWWRGAHLLLLPPLLLLRLRLLLLLLCFHGWPPLELWACSVVVIQRHTVRHHQLCISNQHHCISSCGYRFRHCSLFAWQASKGHCRSVGCSVLISCSSSSCVGGCCQPPPHYVKAVLCLLQQLFITDCQHLLR
jgi:hypothetical protein